MVSAAIERAATGKIAMIAGEEKCGEDFVPPLGSSVDSAAGDKDVGVGAPEIDGGQDHQDEEDQEEEPTHSPTLCGRPEGTGREEERRM